MNPNKPEPLSPTLIAPEGSKYIDVLLKKARRRDRFNLELGYFMGRISAHLEYAQKIIDSIKEQR